MLRKGFLLGCCLMMVLLVGLLLPVRAQDEVGPLIPLVPPASANLADSPTYGEYVLGAGDAINLEDVEMGTLVQDGKILSDGSINLPLVGKVRLAGLSVKAAKQVLQEHYGRYFVHPRITLQVRSQRPVRVYVTGAVAKPGVYLSGKNTRPESLKSVELGNYNTLFLFYRLYLTDALLLAGGLNHNANVTDIRIRRGSPHPEVIHVNLMDLFAGGDVLKDVPLQDQDVIEVVALAPGEVVLDADREAFNQTNVGLGAFNVKVLGAVSQPGVYRMKSGGNVLEAIAEAGGFSDLAEKDKVYVLRTTVNGQVIKRELNLSDRKLVGKKPFEQWARLLPNDVVYVDESASRKALRAGGAVVDRASGAALFPLFNNLFRKD